jgi:hypothetical protein
MCVERNPSTGEVDSNQNACAAILVRSVFAEVAARRAIGTP